jgi:hypothetical protein
MTTNNSLKQEADRLMKIKGNSRGEILRTHAVYIRYRKGEEGIRAVEEKMKELGYPLEFKTIKSLNWYPEAQGVLVILVAKQLFNWTESDIFDMGNSAPKYSFIVKLLLKYFVSLKKSFQEASKYWEKHYDFGQLEPSKINEKEKYLIVRVRGHKFHPIVCTFWRGYFLRFTSYVIKSKNITCRETKCVFKGDPFHEFLIKWE